MRPSHDNSRALLPLTVATLLLSACFGGGNGSSAEKICSAMADCGEISADQVLQCQIETEEALVSAPARALDECLECIETERCTAIDDGACADACDSVLNDQPGDGPDDPPVPTGSFSATRDGDILCPLNTWSNLSGRNTGSLFEVDASCGDLFVDLEFEPMSVGESRTCNFLSISGSSSDSITCFSSGSTFTGSASLVDVGDSLRLLGSCNCFDEFSGMARVTFDVELR